VVFNPGFEDGVASWSFSTDGAGSFTTTTSGVYEGSRSGQVHITTQGGNVKLYQARFSLTARQTYRLRFAAKSSTGHNLLVEVRQDAAPYTNYGLSQTPDLTPDWQVFTYDFVAAGFSGTTTNTQVRFQLGGHDADGDDYVFDSVSLTEVSLGLRRGAKIFAALAPPASRPPPWGPASRRSRGSSRGSASRKCWPPPR
jgi:hypothetical protein